jgi:ABC-2 type transport system ATP-binding protein
MGEGSANAAVRIATLVKHYGRVAALSRIDLEVKSGEAFGLVGANGAGKTTLIKCMLDLCAYDAGSIEIFGLSSGMPESRRRLAYVPERFVPPYYLRCREFLELLVRASDVRYDAARAASMLRDLELEAAVLERPVRQLSKGMTQKLGLAACFLLERDLYVLDEPMSGLDPAARVAVKSVPPREGRCSSPRTFSPTWKSCAPLSQCLRKEPCASAVRRQRSVRATRKPAWSRRS